MTATAEYALKEVKPAELVPSVSRVQNYWGDSGLVLWTGPLKKGPWGKGEYAVVEYDVANPLDESMGDGMWGTERLCTGRAASCAVVPVRHLYVDVADAVAQHLRTKYGTALDRFHDFELKKFAIARGFQMPAVYATIDEHLAWLTTFAPAPAVEWFDPGMAEWFPVGNGDGCDRSGNLLHYARPGNGGAASASDFLKRFGKETVLRWAACEHEEMKALLREKGYTAHKRFLCIYDMKELSGYTGGVMDYAKEFAEMAKHHEHEIVARIFLINVPVVFRGAYKVISVFMDERTRAKVSVLGTDYQEELEKVLDRKYWPAFAGGKNESWYAKKGQVGQPAPAEADRAGKTCGILASATVAGAATETQAVEGSPAATAPAETQKTVEGAAVDTKAVEQGATAVDSEVTTAAEVQPAE